LQNLVDLLPLLLDERLVDGNSCSRYDAINMTQSFDRSLKCPCKAIFVADIALEVFRPHTEFLGKTEPRFQWARPEVQDSDVASHLTNIVCDGIANT
jgi:hypothetical protein